MKTKLKASLEAHIQAWASENCEGEDWPGAWFYTGEVADMTEAAAHVFDVCVSAQRFAKECDDAA